MSEIKIGDRVRSFDFDCRDITGERACYIEGCVEDISDRLGYGFDQYHIRVERQIFGGVQLPRGQSLVGEVVYPPVNGTPRIPSGVTGFVVVIEPAKTERQAGAVYHLVDLVPTASGQYHVERRPDGDFSDVDDVIRELRAQSADIRELTGAPAFFGPSAPIKDIRPLLPDPSMRVFARLLDDGAIGYFGFVRSDP